MKLVSIFPLLAVATALPAASDLSPRASIAKVDGLKFNIDGVTKCRFL
jgi:mannan endo-1,4-beta-mannosidase